MKGSWAKKAEGFLGCIEQSIASKERGYCSLLSTRETFLACWVQSRRELGILGRAQWKAIIVTKGLELSSEEKLRELELLSLGQGGNGGSH